MQRDVASSPRTIFGTKFAAQETTMSSDKPPVIMGDVTKVFNEPFTPYERQRLQNVQQALCMRQRRIVALKKALAKRMGEAKKENEDRLLGEGGTTLAIARGTYPKTVECTCMVDEITWEVFLTRKDDGREVPGSRRALTDAQIKAHKKSRAQLGMFGEGSWTPIRLPELANDSAQQCDDIPVEELESAATAEVINLDDVRAMLASDLLAMDAGDDDDEDEDERPRKRKGKGKDAKEGGADASDKKRKGKPELHVVKSPEPAESGPYAADANDDTLTSASTTMPPSVRVVYVLCVDGALDTLNTDEIRHVLNKCAVIHGAADKINEHALPDDGMVMDRGALSTGHNYAIHQLADTSLAGLNTLVLEDGGKLLGYVLQDEPRALGVDVETTVAEVGVSAQPQPMPRPTITMPDTLKSEVVSTLKTAIRNNGGSANAGELLTLFAKESEFDVADVPALVRDNLVPICNELVLDGVLVGRGGGDDVTYVMPNVVQHEHLH